MEAGIASRGVAMPGVEDQLAARCRAGDMEAFSEVYACYERQVFRYAYHLLGHREDADDVKQETFVRAYQAIGKFRSDSSLQTWLFKICGNLCRDRLKSWEKRKIQYDAGLHSEEWRDEGYGSDPHALVERAETTATVLCALRGMPLAQREIIVLHDLEELSYQEIGAILGCSAVSAKLRVFRARRSLRERVQVLER